MNAYQVLSNLAGSMGDVLDLLFSISYVMGGVCIVLGLLLARRASDERLGRGESKTGWVGSLIAAAVFLALPSILNTGGQMLYGQDVQTSLVMDYASDPVNRPLAPLVPLIKVIGVIAVIRSIWVAREISVRGATEKNSVSRVLVLFFSGIALVHFFDTLAVVRNLTGLNIGMNLF